MTRWATSTSLVLVSCESLRSISNARTSSILKRSMMMPLAWPMRSRVDSADCSCSLSRLAKIAEAACAASTMPIVSASLFHGLGSYPNRLSAPAVIGRHHVADLAELNRLFAAWVETVYHRTVHSETGQTPLARWSVSGPVGLPAPEALAEAFLWEEHRRVTKTATVSLHGNSYEVDPALVGRKVELVFDPFDLARIEVRLAGVPMGLAIPHHIGRHSHPKAKPEVAPFPELFEAPDHTVAQRVYYALIHLGDPLIRLESLYRYLRKFHALGRRRYVLVSARHIPAALVVLLSLEFLPHRSRRR